ncbi:hypothetical protein VSR34_12405 [Paraburkholderia sp. JHI2823]|uniref:hypothetical protein n=1 Tax=Paraburkholderia sp. JHI2823 TaxID=3112960 RepID=UPI00316B61EF
MNNETPARMITQTLSANTELYNRCEATGHLLPRLGFAGDFLRTVNILQVQQNVVVQNVVMLDQAAVIDVLDALPAKLQRRALVTSYGAILNSFRSYTDHNFADMLMRTIALCNEKAPEFQLGLVDELQAIDPEKYWGYSKKASDAALEPLRTTSMAYVGMLMLGFHALTISRPATASRETVILGQIDEALTVLRQKLRETLVPGGRVKGSLLLSTLINPDDTRFGRYLPYHGSYSSPTGFQALISQANTLDCPSISGVAVSPCKPSEQHALLADMLIEIIECFESLRKLRLNYLPEAAAESSATLAVNPASGS